MGARAKKVTKLLAILPTSLINKMQTRCPEKAPTDQGGDQWGHAQSGQGGVIRKPLPTEQFATREVEAATLPICSGRLKLRCFQCASLLVMLSGYG
jgi:hypothetical protein